MPESEPREGLFRLKGAECPFETLVALHVRWPGNRVGTSFPLNLRLEVDEHHVAIPTTPGLLTRLSRRLSGRNTNADGVLRLRIRIRHCHVRYHSQEIAIIAESKYESAIVEGRFQAGISGKSRIESKTHLGGKIGAGAKIKQADAQASLDAHFIAMAAREQNHSVETTTRMIPEIFEVQAVPNGWRVGHPDWGDPSKPSQCLGGRYFDRAIAGHPHTCAAEFLLDHKRGTLTFTVSVRDGLHVARLDGGNVGRDEEHRAVAAMRDRMAALRLERHLSQASPGEMDGEIPIYTCTYEVVRGADEDELGLLRHSEMQQSADKKDMTPATKSRRTRRGDGG